MCSAMPDDADLARQRVWTASIAPQSVRGSRPNGWERECEICQLLRGHIILSEMVPDAVGKRNDAALCR